MANVAGSGTVPGAQPPVDVCEVEQTAAAVKLPSLNASLLPPKAVVMSQWLEK